MLDEILQSDLVKRIYISSQQWISAGLILVTCLLSGCGTPTIITGRPDALQPRGVAASNISDLWWIMFWLSLVVAIVVFALLLYPVLMRIRQGRAHDLEEVSLEAPSGRAWLWWGGIILPGIIIAITFIASLGSMAFLERPPEQETVTIEVIGRQWFWQVRYPDGEFDTANEIHIPVGQPVMFRLSSNDVIHSFWIPQLHGKMDLNPHRTNTIWIQADEPGIYRGLCAEFCGLQHAKMQFLVIAESPEEFAAWVERERQDAAEPQGEMAVRGRELFMSSSCVFCHTVRGTEARGNIGPDLTHIGSRLTIGAAALDNNRGNLGGWIVNPQHVKPGVLMPPTDLESEDLQILLAYLESLR